jgi:hypothetical protein
MISALVLQVLHHGALEGAVHAVVAQQGGALHDLLLVELAQHDGAQAELAGLCRPA